MRVKSRVLIVAAVAAAFLGAGPAFASDDSPAPVENPAPSPSAPAESPAPSAPAESPDPSAPAESPDPSAPEPVPSPGVESPEESEADAAAPIEEEPNYTG